MSNSPIQPVGKQGTKSGQAPTATGSRKASDNDARKPSAGASAPTQTRDAAPAETLRLLGKIEEHVGKLRTAIEAPAAATPNPASNRPSQGPSARR